MPEDDENGSPAPEPEPEPTGHHCEHCEEIADMHQQIITLAAAQAVNASADEDAALTVLADALEIPADEPTEAEVA